MLENLANSLINIDVTIFYFCNVYLQNPAFDGIMPVITYAGTQIFWVLICIGLFVWGGEKGKNTAILCLLALFIGFFASELLKYLFARPRPYEVLHGIHYFMDAQNYAFPSGHSTAAFTGSTIIGIKYGYLYLLLGLAGLVAFSRVYIGVHYPSDVIIGAILGVLCALLVLKLEGKLLRTKNKILNT
jgi:undecaprenyl-diphosphatase